MRYLFTLLSLGATLGLSAQTRNVEDIDKNSYKTKLFNKTEWMIENLKVEHYNNGDAIVDGNLEDVNSEIFDSYDPFTGRMMHMNNDPENTKIFGRLYNFNVTEDERKICPTGWEIPSYKDFLELADFIMNTEYAEGTYQNDKGDFSTIKIPDMGTILKSEDLWAENLGGKDEWEFNLLPTGFRNRFDASTFPTISYIQMNETARMWCKEHMRANGGNARMSMVITNRDTPSDKVDYDKENSAYNSSFMYIAGTHHTEGQNIRCIRHIKSDITSIEETNEYTLEIYPNPASSYILINSNKIETGTVEIYKVSVETVTASTLSFINYKIDI